MQGAAIVYDVSDRSSFADCVKWFDRLNTFSVKSRIILLAHRYQRESLSQVSAEEGRELASERGAIFLEACSLNDVSEVFMTLGDMVIFYLCQKKVGEEVLK